MSAERSVTLDLSGGHPVTLKMARRHADELLRLVIAHNVRLAEVGCHLEVMADLEIGLRDLVK